ncbi:hypothetical protein BD560DRAFT_491226 [Blakeslea trispora]|nr:hypothetical protein BD560DRAFT_491226 [Blakeslea trispora]
MQHTLILNLLVSFVFTKKVYDKRNEFQIEPELVFCRFIKCNFKSRFNIMHNHQRGFIKKYTNSPIVFSYCLYPDQTSEYDTRHNQRGAKLAGIYGISVSFYLGSFGWQHLLLSNSVASLQPRSSVDKRLLHQRSPELYDNISFQLINGIVKETLASLLALQN